MKRFKLILTEKQIELIEVALFEWAGLCRQEAQGYGKSFDEDGQFNLITKSPSLMRQARDMNKVRSSIVRQMEKAKGKG